MKFNEQKLKEKGWSQEEIDQAKSIIKSAHKNKHPTHKYLEKSMYWVLFVIILAIAIGGLYLIKPFLLIMKPITAYIVIGIIGLVFGSFAGVIVKDIEELEKHHHLAISIIIPIAAIITSIDVSKKVIIAANEVSLNVIIHPIMLGIIFSIFTLIPYGIFVWSSNKKRLKK